MYLSSCNQIIFGLKRNQFIHINAKLFNHGIIYMKNLIESENIESLRTNLQTHISQTVSTNMKTRYNLLMVKSMKRCTWVTMWTYITENVLKYKNVN